ncbi:mitochondrial ribosome assembly protein RRG9 [Sporobolomyces koalae]|uniref:mitochondrial ribosome assembly protein RRG9 n=1 Tax=Sporobolomyces koalae TaxID=500713 RepID=UPI00316D2F5D
MLHSSRPVTAPASDRDSSSIPRRRNSPRGFQSRPGASAQTPRPSSLTSYPPNQFRSTTYPTPDRTKTDRSLRGVTDRPGREPSRIEARLKQKRQREQLDDVAQLHRIDPSVEARSSRPLPEWKKHKLALQDKFPNGWNPPKRISREAMDLVKTLHRVDPVTHSIPVLSERFKLSPEAVRRVLKSRFELSKDEQDKRERKRRLERDRQLDQSQATWEGDRSREKSEMSRLRERHDSSRTR